MEPKRKQFKIDLSKDLKLEEGQGQAIIATLNVEDHDGDVILPGAIGKEQHASILPAHNRGAASMGKAIVREVGNHLIADFMFNLDPDHKTAREWHSSLKFDKENGVPVQEWSFALVNMKTEQGPFGESDRRVNFIKSFEIPEVSPVLRGASIGTGTLSIKDQKSLTFKEEMEKASQSLVDVKAVITRTQSLVDMRKAAGKKVSAERIDGLKSLHDSLEELLTDANVVILEASTKSEDPQNLLAEYQKTLYKNRHLLEI